MTLLLWSLLLLLQLNLLLRLMGMLLAIHKMRKKSGNFQGKGPVFICAFRNWQDHVELFDFGYLTVFGQTLMEFSRVHLKNFRTHFLFSWKLPIFKCYVINLGERLSKVSPRYFASCSIKIAIFVQLCPPCGYIIPNHCLTRIIRNKTRVAVTNNSNKHIVCVLFLILRLSQRKNFCY